MQRFYVFAATLVAVLVLFAKLSVAQQIQPLSEVLPLFKDVLGLASLPANNVKKGPKEKTASVTFRGKPATVMTFQVNGVTLGAMVPSNFQLTDVFPIPHGTPIDGVSLSNMAFIYLPKGHKPLTVPLSGYPQTLQNSLSHLTTGVVLNEGFNLHGVGNFQPSKSIHQVMSTIGYSQFKLPIVGTFSNDIFKSDPKKASAKVKGALLQSLKLDVSLPKLKIPGMPDSVAVNHARLTIVGREVKGKAEVFAGVTGDLNVKVGSTAHGFDFGILAVNPGKVFKPVITADSKDTVKLPFYQALSLTNMQLVAEKKGSKWDTVVNASAKLKGKTIAVSVRHDPKVGDRAFITTKMKLADLLPSGTSFPGVTDVEFDTIEVAKDSLLVSGKIKDMDAVVAGFNHRGKTLIAVTTPKPVHISNLIPTIGKTPLDDVPFNAMTYLWAPKGTPAGHLTLSDLPPAIATVVRKAGTTINVEAGVNVTGQMGIARNGELGKLLVMANLYKSALPLAGNLSPAIFQKGNAAQLKNEILDNLDLNIPLPKINIPGISTIAKIQHTSLAIKGQNEKGVRSIDVAVGGELDITTTGTKLQLDYKAVVHKQSGKPDSLALTAKQPENKPVTIKLLEIFQVTDLDFKLTKQNGKYNGQLLGSSTFRGKPVRVGLNIGPKPNIYVAAKELTLKALTGSSIGVPEIDNIAFSGLGVSPDYFSMGIEVQGQRFYGLLFKPPGQAKPFFILRGAKPKLSIAALIPGADKTPLKDTDFEEAVLFYNPTNKAGLLNTFPASLRPYFHGNVAVKPGLNIYGTLAVHPSGEMANLLKMAGIRDVKLPLNGTFSPKVFSKDITAVKNAIIDSLDLNIPLPKINVPGITKIANIQSTRLSIKGENKNGTRSIDVALGGALDIDVTGQKLSFDYQAELTKPQGKPEEFKLIAKQPKAKPVTIKLIESFTLKNLELEVFKRNNDYIWFLHGDTTFRSKAVNVTYSQVKAPYLWVASSVTTKNLTGGLGVPDFDNIKLAGFAIEPGQFSGNLKIRDKKYWFSIDKVPGQSKPYALLWPAEAITLSELVPGADNTPLKSISFHHVSIIYSPAKTTQTVHQVFKSDNVWTKVIDQNAALKPGLNLFATVDVAPTGEMATILKSFGVNHLELPLNGGLSPKMFAQSVNTQAVRNAVLDGLDLKFDIPPPRIQEMTEYLAFKNGHLGIKGKLPDGKRGVAFQVSGDAELRIANEDIAFFVEVDVDRSQGGQETDLEVKGHTDKPWVHPMGISFLTLEELALDIRKQKTGSTKTYDVSLSAKTDIGSHSKLDV
ncbi:MAG: hypothetical protein OQJ97_08485, partial [Rhodospirillales bacterium]|nr:hypothetical protein [Rhodospirillales bacterium]